MGLISRVSSRTYRDTSILTASMTETSEKPEKKSGWGNLLTNIIAGEPVASTSDESSPDEIDSPSEEGVVNLEKEQKREKKLTKKREAEKNESDSDDDGITTVSERQRKHREWEMIARTFPDRADTKERVQEQALKRAARRGVVQLFNAVKEHQRQLQRKQRAEISSSGRPLSTRLKTISSTC